MFELEFAQNNPHEEVVWALDINTEIYHLYLLDEDGCWMFYPRKHGTFSEIDIDIEK